MSKYVKVFVIAVNGVINSNVCKDLKGCANVLGMNYDSVKAKKRVNGVRKFKGGLTITECSLIGSKRKGNVFKFDPEYKAKKKLMGTIPATEEEQKMLNWRNNRDFDENV